MSDYPDGPSLAERSGYAQLGTTFSGDPYAPRPKNTNPDCNRELRENSIVRQGDRRTQDINLNQRH
jgi:hypothetical protein